MSNADSLYQPPPPPPPPPPHPGSNTMALTSVSSGIGAWLITLGTLAVPCSGPLAFVAAMVAVITGHIGRSQLAKGEGRPGDGKLVTIGLVSGYLHLGITVVLLAIVIMMVMGGLTWGMLLEQYLGR